MANMLYVPVNSEGSAILNSGYEKLFKVAILQVDYNVWKLFKLNVDISDWLTKMADGKELPRLSQGWHERSMPRQSTFFRQALM